MHPVAYPLRIIGSGIHIPEQVVSSQALEAQNGWVPESVAKLTGVKCRNWAGPSEDISSMGASALQAALNDADISYNQLDLVVSASATYDYPIPHNSCLLQQKMAGREKPVPGWDIDATCLGFITALDVASRLLDGKRYTRIAIVCSEICSTSLNPHDQETYSLLADGAVAFIVEKPDDAAHGIVTAHMQTWPEGAMLANVPAGGHKIPGLSRPDASQFYFHMDGHHLLHIALKHLKPFTSELLRLGDTEVDALDAIVPHQASINGINGFMRLMHIAPKKMVINIDRYGNTLSASVGIALHEALKSGTIVAGNRVMLIGTGAGFSIGGIILIL